MVLGNLPPLFYFFFKFSFWFKAYKEKSHSTGQIIAVMDDFGWPDFYVGAIRCLGRVK